MYSIKWYNYITTQSSLKYCVIYNPIVCLKIFSLLQLAHSKVHIVTHLYVYHLFAIEIFLNIFSSTHTFSFLLHFLNFVFCSSVLESLWRRTVRTTRIVAHIREYFQIYIHIYLYVFPWCIHECLCVYSWVRALLICGHLSALGLNYWRQHVNPFMTKYLSHPIIQKLTYYSYRGDIIAQWNAIYERAEEIVIVLSGIKRMLGCSFPV